MDALEIKECKEYIQKETDDDFPEDKESSDNSEYDSADADSDSDNENVRSKNSNKDEQANSEDGDFILEREEGDGQESIPNKKVDDDEDKKNPQYIPKRGTFYEHDDRTLEDGEKVEEEPEKDKDGKKKVWQDKKEKWAHDRFNEPEQAPKSKAELIAIYGYDIRNEEGAPRARRRRKYGRGPNKYTRNWEDEDAYNKPAPTVIKKNKKPIPRQDDEEFPPLIHNADFDQDVEDEPKNLTMVEEKPQLEQFNLRNEELRKKTDFQESRSDYVSNNINNQEHYNKSNQQCVGSGRINNSKIEPKDLEINGFTTKSRISRNRKVLPPRNQQKEDFIQSQNFYLSNRNNDLEKEMGKMSIEEGSKTNSKKNNYNSGNSSSQRQNSMPPRLQSEQKGSKRYSSIRQKSLPETNTTPISNYQHGPTFYPNEYNQQSVSSSALHQNPQIMAAPTQVAHVSPLQQASLPQQVPATAAPLLQAATFAPQAYPQPPPAFIQPAAVAGPTFLPPPQTTQLINFVQSQPAFQPSFQGYQQPFNAVSQQAELYQPQGGITYYSTDQQLLQRQVPQKRPKAAIPIVAPPSFDKREDNDACQIENTESFEMPQ